MDDHAPSRRDALKVGALLGGATGISALLGAVPRPSLAASRERRLAPYDLADPARLVATTCAGCTGGCPIRAARTDERLLAKVDGNPYSPRQGGDPLPTDLQHAARLRGASCARGQSRVNVVHDPWRLVRPLLRTGPRGTPTFRTADPQSWREAVVPRLVRLHEEAMGGRTERLLVAVDRRQQDRRPLLDAFTAQHAGCRAILGHPAPRLAQASTAAVGSGWLAAPRWERATLAVAWGADPVSTGLDPVGSARALAGRRDRVVVVDPRLSATGTLAGSWVPVRVGGDAALAGFVARVWAEQGLVEPAFVPDAVRDRPTAELEHRTGLGEEVVRRFARQLWDAGPGLAVAIGGALDEEDAAAVLALCARTGALGATGAMAPARDPIPAVDGPVALRDAVCGDHPPDALILVGDASLQDTPELEEVVEALADPARVGLVVLVGRAPGPLLGVADAVWPDVTELERFGLVRRHDGTSVALPAVAPLVEGGGLEGLLDAVAVAATRTAVATPSFVDAVTRASAGLTGPEPGDDATLDLALGHVTLPVLPFAARTLLARGWLPPEEHAPPAVGRLPLVVELGAPPADGLTLVSYAEPFAGQPDSDADAWGARTVRRDNEAHVHPATLAALGAGETGHVVLSVGAARATLKAHPSTGVRRDIVALARGYGQRTGYTGDLVIDGVPVPGQADRCAGTALGPLLGAPLQVAAAEAPDDGGWLEWLTPGGHRRAT